MVYVLNHTNRKKPKITLSTSKSLHNFSDKLNLFSDNQTPSVNNLTGITSPPPFYTKRPNKLRLTRFHLFPKRQPLSQPTFNYRTSTLSSSQEQHPTLPNYSSANTTQHDNFTTQNDNVVDHTSVNDDTDSSIIVYSETIYLFPPPSF